jgi:hypothetical protein
MDKKGITVDDEFLKDYIDKHGSFEVTEKRIDKENLDQFLDEVAGPPPPPASQLHKKVAKATGDDKQEQADKEEAARQKKREQQQEKAKNDLIKDLPGSVTGLADPLIEHASNAADQVSSWQTAGGIGLLLIILMLLLFIIVQVNAAGDTRLKQLWYMLNGRAQLQGRIKPDTTGQNPDAQIQNQDNQNIISAPPVFTTASSSPFRTTFL